MNRIELSVNESGGVTFIYTSLNDHNYTSLSDHIYTNVNKCSGTNFIVADLAEGFIRHTHEW